MGMLVPSCFAADYAAAFLENGVGSRGVGMGGAFVAAVDDASASYWNPAGLLRSEGKGFMTVVQPMSLDRRQNSFSARLNLRDEFAFGFTWIHARVSDVVGRSAIGVPTGNIEDSQNAYQVAVARRLHPRLLVGAITKVMEHEISVPWRGSNRGRGHGFDLGLQVLIYENAYLGVVVRNINADISWKVKQNNQQSTNTDDSLPQTLVLGLAHEPLEQMVLATDVHIGDDTYFNLGFEWAVSPVLVLRGGLNRIPGDGISVNSTTAGLSLRPMRMKSVQFHYTYATDPLNAGGRTVAGVAIIF